MQRGSLSPAQRCGHAALSMGLRLLDWLIDRLHSLRQRLGTVLDQSAPKSKAGRLRMDGFEPSPLKTSEQTLQAIIENAPLGLYTTRQGVDIDFANQYIVTLLGLSPEEKSGDEWVRLLHPDDRGWVIQAVTGAVATGQGFEVEYRFVDRSGNLRWALDRAIPIRDLAGQIQFYQGFVLDITERKHQEEQLQTLTRQLQQRTAELVAAQAQMQAILEHTPAFIHIIELDGRVRFVNHQWQALAGQAIGRHISEFFTAEETAEFLSQNQAVVSSGKAMTFESSIIFPDGGVRTFVEVKFPLPESMQAGQAICGIALDVTEYRQTAAALQRSERHLRAILDHVPLGLYTDGADYPTCQFVNQYWVSWAGVTPEELLGNGWIERVHAEDRERVVSQAAKASAVGEVFEAEFRVVDREGRVYWVLDRSVPIQDESGRVLFYQGFMLDITERKHQEHCLQRLTQQLQSQNEKLEEVSRLKSEFLTNMSHELRTPLTSVLGFSSVLLQQIFGPLTPKQQEYLTLIRNSGSHLLNLINDLLDLSKIESGKMELNLKAVALEDLCREALQMVEVTAQRKQQLLCLEQPVAVESAVVDRQRVVQMLLNYLSNAVKFTPEGGRITLGTRLASRQELESQTLGQAISSTTGFLVLSVEDTGIGIALEQQHLLFQLFQQVDGATNRQYEGTGLGLALTRMLAELHGGVVSVRSTPGQGSTFSVWLPLPAPISEDAP